MATKSIHGRMTMQMGANLVKAFKSMTNMPHGKTSICAGESSINLNDVYLVFAHLLNHFLKSTLDRFQPG